MNFLALATAVVRLKFINFLPLAMPAGDDRSCRSTSKNSKLELQKELELVELELQ